MLFHARTGPILRPYLVQVKMYTANSHHWVNGKINSVTGSLTYTISLEDGRLCRRHVNDLKYRPPPTQPPQSLPTQPKSLIKEKRTSTRKHVPTTRMGL